MRLVWANQHLLSMWPGSHRQDKEEVEEDGAQMRKRAAKAEAQRGEDNEEEVLKE